jgi:hypothetical protein
MAYNFSMDSISVPFVTKLMEKAPIIMNSNKQLDKEFKKGGQGTTMVVSIPDYSEIVTGGDITAAASSHSYTSGERTIELDQKTAFENMTNVERALELKNFAGQIAEPNAARLASYVQKEVADTVKLGADIQQVISSSDSFGEVAVTTAGIRKARSNGKLVGILDPMLSARISSTGLNFFNPQKTVSKLYEEFGLGTFAQAEFYTCNDVADLVTGDLALGTATVDGALAEGATSLVIADAALAGGEVIKKGQSFNVAGVNAVDIYGEDVGLPYAFVAQADAVASAGSVTITIKPISYAKPTTNVSIVVADGAAVTQLQDASSTYLAGIIYDKESLIFASAPMHKSAGASVTSSKVNQLSVKCLKATDPLADKEIIRWDILCGSLLVRTNWAATIWMKV